MTRAQFQANVLNYMDAEDSARWTPPTIISVGGIVSATEWSGIMDQNQYYHFSQLSVTTDSSGRVALSSLDSGSGDSAQYFNKLLVGFTDGNVLWTETDFRYVPMATQTNWQNPYSYQYYLSGDYFQLLPVATGTALTATLNWLPATIAQLADDNSLIIFPRNYEWILVWVTAATLLLKGGTESQAASDLFALADSARKQMLGSIARLTTRPTSALLQDAPESWGGVG